jgi:hypothetical protein
MARTSDVGAPAVGAARRTASPSDADELFRDLYAEHRPALLRLTTALTGATSRWPKRRGYCRSGRARSDHTPSTG